MSLTDPLAALRQACFDPQAAAGRPVVACLGQAVPVELILAAGAFPLAMRGDPLEETPLAERFIDDDFDAELKSVYQRIVSGYYNAADLIVIPRSSNGYLYLYYFLLETRRMLPDYAFPEVVLFDVLNTPYWSTGQYVQGRVLALREKLEQLCGRSIGDAALRDAIAVSNGWRSALQALNGLRRAGRLQGSDLLAAVAAAGCIGPEAAAELARAAAAQAAQSETRGGMRLMVKGAAQGDSGFYALAESLGALVVADDHATGEGSFEHLVDPVQDPVAALTEHYQLHVPGIRSFPQAAQDRRFMGIVAAAGVEGVVFFHDEFDDTLGWDYPEQKRLLDERGIPSVFLQQQSWRAPDRAAQEAALRALLERKAP
jgi:benzoyl-CoA reductase/2-hydroxyglutaryl-CoA dehydratase subunit BcrC/BadD/HgdB